MCNLYRLSVTRWEITEGFHAANAWGEGMKKDYVSPERAGPVVLVNDGVQDPTSHVVGAVHPNACPAIVHDEEHDRRLDPPVGKALTLAVPHPSQLLHVEP